MKLKLGELNATLLCHYTSMAEVVSAAFGDGGGDGKQSLIKGEYTDLADAPTFEAAIANINRAMRV